MVEKCKSYRTSGAKRLHAREPDFDIWLGRLALLRLSPVLYSFSRLKGVITFSDSLLGLMLAIWNGLSKPFNGLLRGDN
jgi:hypothetical protein